jgi:homeobox-leucine zipper protein
MELGLSLGEAAVADAGRAPELLLGLGVGAGTGDEGEKRRREVTAGAGWWAAAASPEPSVRLSLVSTLGLRWPSETGEWAGTCYRPACTRKCRDPAVLV